MIVTQWGLQMRRGVHIAKFYLYGSASWGFCRLRPLARSIWEQTTEKARLARSNGPDLHHNSVHVMIYPSKSQALRHSADPVRCRGAAEDKIMPFGI